MKKRQCFRFSFFLSLCIVVVIEASFVLSSHAQTNSKGRLQFLKSTSKTKLMERLESSDQKKSNLSSDANIPSDQSMRDRQTNQTRTGQNKTDPMGRPLFHQGMLTLKLKQRIESTHLGKGNVTLGLRSLDQKFERFKVKSVEKRFHHRPIPPGSNLPDLSKIYKITIPEETDVMAAVRAFSEDPNVEYAEPIPIMYAHETPNDTLFSVLQHLPQIMAGQAWDIHKGEAGDSVIVIGICDSGVDWDHPDLIDNLWRNLGEDLDGDGSILEWDGSAWIFDPDDINGLDDDENGYPDDFIGWDFMANDWGEQDNNPNDPSDHGTHVAGIAAGATNNVTGISSISWNVKFLPTSHSYAASGWGYYIWYGYDGIIYLAENGADIINCSWGGYYYSRAEEEVIAYASGLGSIIVSSAGNDNSEKLGYPPTYPHVISVASVASTDVKASYSDYGVNIDVSAPGGDPDVDGGILSTIPDNTYDRFWGTSMASPLVAGLLGLIKSYHPDWTNEQLVTQLLGTADDINEQNPNYINKLGSGRINAYRAITETEVTARQVLRLALHELLPPNYADGNGSIQAGETFSLNLIIRNFAHFASSEDVKFTLSTQDPDVQILNPTHNASVGDDGYTKLENVFEIQVNQDAKPHFAQFNLTAQCDIQVNNKIMEFELMIAPSGIFVWEGVKEGEDHSGKFISDFLTNQAIDHFYTNTFPWSLLGYDVVFLSFGSYGNEDFVGFSNEMADVVTAYLESGGCLYLEGNDALGWDQSANDTLLGLFGLEETDDGSIAWNWIENLVGKKSALTAGLQFTWDTQLTPISIDRYTPDETGIAAFEEDYYGVVAVQNEGIFGQKTFCFSYALSELMDDELPNSRYNLLARILNFFQFDIPLAVDFNVDTETGHAPLTVQFHDLTYSLPETAPTAWAWDFDNNGTVDSNEQNPGWTYTIPGDYSIRLEVTGGAESKSLTRMAYVRVFDGESALYFDGKNLSSAVYVQPHPSLNLTQAFTLEAWIKPAGWGPYDPSGYARIVDKGMILLFLHNDGHYEYAEQSLVLALDHADYTSSRINTPANSIVLDTWQHVAVTYDGSTGTAEIFINGVKQEVDQIIPPSGELLNHQDEYLLIGNAISHERTFQGLIDEVRIWNLALPGKQLHSNFDESLTGDEEGLAGYWRMNEGSGEWIEDLSQNENWGELYRTMWVHGLPPELTFVNDEDQPARTPASFMLSQNYPNPFNPTTEIRYALPKASPVTFRIYNIRGQEVWRMELEGIQPAGFHSIMWDGRDNTGIPLTSGVYLYRLETADFVKVRKMTLMK